MQFTKASVSHFTQSPKLLNRLQVQALRDQIDTMRYPSNRHHRISSSGNACSHNLALTSRALGFRRSASVGCPCWPTSPTMPVTSSSKRQAHSVGHIPAKLTLKKRALAPKRSNSLHEELTHLNFTAEDGQDLPHLLLPTLATDPNEHHKAIRLEFRPSHPVTPVEIEASEDEDMPSSLPLIPTLDDFNDEDQDELPIRLTPRPTFTPLLEPPAPPMGKRRRVISFDSTELSDDLFFPVDGW